MKYFIVLLSILYLASARSIHEADENSEDSNLRLRHRRRSREPYDYNSYYDNRAYYGRRQEDMLSEITSLLQEISAYVKRPTPLPPPPQIVYVPYPVSYPTSAVSCSSNPNSTGKPNSIIENITDRTGIDKNRIWGQTSEETNIDDSNDGARKVSLTPIAQKKPVPEPPPVEHGSNQAGMSMTTTEATPRKSLICQAAIIICCDKGDEERKKCFESYRCSRTFATNVACHPAVIKKAYEEFINQYADSE